MKVLVVLLLLAVVALAHPSIKSTAGKIQASAAKYCSDPTPHNQQRLISQLSNFELSNEEDEQVASYARGVLDGSIQGGEQQQARAVNSDSITVSCDTTPVDVEFGTATVNCYFNIALMEGIFYYYVYAYYTTSTGGLEVVPSNYYYYDSSAALTSVNSSTVVTLPQYAPSGAWALNAYAYTPNYDNYYSASAAFYVAATVNDQGPPVLTSLYIPVVDSLASTTSYVSFSATDDLSGINEFYAYFYDTNYVDYLGYAYWTPPSQTPFLSLSTSATFQISSSNIPLGTYLAYVYLYDKVGFYVYYYPDTLSSMGFQSTVTNAANNCTAGKYLPYGSSGACLQCAAGTYSTYGAISCTTCPPGTKGNGKGASSCPACPAGSFSYGGNAGCALCPVGKYSYSSGTPVCYPCQAGYYVNATGSTSCLGCAAGYHSCGGATSCTACTAGTYSTGYAAVCSQCAPGTYASTAAASSCTPCPAGTYAAKVGATSCTACPTGTSPAGSYSVLSCA